MRKVGLYLRVSTEEQAKIHEGSLISQRQRLEDYIKGRNMMESSWGKVTGVFIDEARSGKDTNRPEFKRLLREVEVGNINTVLVTELSRLSRNMKDFCTLWDFLKGHDASFLSLREQFDTTTAAGEMMIFSIMNFAQFERKQTSERVSANFQSRAQRGLFNGGFPALGYDTNPEKKGLLVVNEKEAVQVRRIFQIFLEEGRIAPTIERLKDEGIRTKKRIRKDGKVIGGKDWRINSLWNILTNRHFIGEREINKKAKVSIKSSDGKKSYQITSAQWAPVVSKSVFERAQVLLKENTIRYSSSTRKPFNYSLTSRVVCPECKAALVGYSGRGKLGQKYFYYSHREKPVRCRLKRISAPKLQAAIEGRFKALVNAPAMLEKLHAAFKAETEVLVPENRQQLSSIRSELATLEIQSRNLLDQLQKLPQGSDLILERVQELEQRTHTLRQEERRIEHDLAIAEQNSFNPVRLDTMLQGWKALSAHMTESERREFVRILIGTIEVSPKQVRIRYNCDMKAVNSAMELFRSMAPSFSKKTGQLFENEFFSARGFGRYSDLGAIHGSGSPMDCRTFGPSWPSSLSHLLFSGPLGPMKSNAPAWDSNENSRPR